jgi:hypothetical protein
VASLLAASGRRSLQSARQPDTISTFAGTCSAEGQPRCHREGGSGGCAAGSWRIDPVRRERAGHAVSAPAADDLDPGLPGREVGHMCNEFPGRRTDSGVGHFDAITAPQSGPRVNSVQSLRCAHVTRPFCLWGIVPRTPNVRSLADSRRSRGRVWGRRRSCGRSDAGSDAECDASVRNAEVDSHRPHGQALRGCDDLFLLPIGLH